MRLLLALILVLAVSVCAFGQNYTINTFAGGGLPNNVPATSMRLSYPGGVAVDSAGNTYIAETGLNAVARVDATTGQLTWIAGYGPQGYSGDNGPATSALLDGPVSITVDASGNVYIADSGNNVIRKISNNIITTIAGNGTAGYSGDNGPATSAELDGPVGIAVDASGNVYVADSENNVIRKISNNVITTIAGNGTAGYSGDNGPATSAELWHPYGVALDASGNVYIADTWNNVIREVSNGVITTFAGTGTHSYSGDNGIATKADLFNPTGVAVDASGDVYIADYENNRIRKVSNDVITTFAGNGTAGYSGDNGKATNAELNQPIDVAVDASGNVYIADYYNNVIRRVVNGGITTLAGGGSGYFGDNGPATQAGLSWLLGVSMDVAGSVYIADIYSNVIRKVSNGVITTIAGNGYDAGTGYGGYSGDNGPATSAELNQPQGVAVDASGNVYFADSRNNVIRKVSNGVITTIAGSGYRAGTIDGGYTGDNGPATEATMWYPTSVAVDTAGNVFIADTNNSAIRKVSNGIITTIAGNGTVGYSGDNGPAISATLGGPTGMALDASGNLYFADGGTRIRKISNGVITTIAGNGISGYSGDNGPATSAWLWDPSGVTVDASGNLYIADTENNVVREVSNGRITTIAGNGKRGYLGNNGLAVSAELDHPTGVAVDATGEVYIADSWNSVIRVLGPSPLSAQTASLTAAAADGSIQVTVPDGLSWTASSNDSWITITSGASGTGSGALTFSVQANNTGAVRTGTIIIDGQTFKIEQGSGAATGLILAGSMPQIASGGGWDTSLTLVNNNGQGVGELSLNFYANDGSQLLIPFTFPQQPTQGTILGATFLQYPFNAYATLVLDTTGPTSQPTVTGSCELFGGGIGAFAIFKYTPSGQEAVVPLETRNASSYLLAFDNTGQIDTGLAIANLATAAANVNVIIRDDTGAQIGTGTINLAAQGHNSFMLTDTTQGFPVTADKRGTVEFDTPQGGQISVLGLRANGAALTSLPVLANVGTTGGTMAHVASGGGWQTIFTLVNTGTASANATLNFFDDNGAALLLPLDFPQTGAAFTESSVTQAIPAGAILMIVTQGQNSGNSVTGSAQLTTNGNVSGFAIFQNTAAGQEAVVPLQTNYYGAYVLAFDNTNGLATGVAIANMAAQAADVSVVIRDDTGTQIGTGTISLAAQGHTSFMLTDASQGFPVTAGIRGTVEFDAPSADQIAVLGIRATPAGAFTTIPAM